MILQAITILKLVAKFATKTVPQMLPLCIVQSNKHSKSIEWCEQGELGKIVANFPVYSKRTHKYLPSWILVTSVRWIFITRITQDGNSVVLMQLNN